jgi:hypothetical protein
LRIGEANFGGFVLDVFDDGEHAREAGFAGFGVDFAANVVFGAIAGLGRLLDRVFHRLDDDLAIDRFFARD